MLAAGLGHAARRDPGEEVENAVLYCQLDPDVGFCTRVDEAEPGLVGVVEAVLGSAKGEVWVDRLLDERQADLYETRPLTIENVESKKIKPG